MSTTSLLAAVSCAFFFWFRNNGMAIAARTPMMTMTTRSSMSVKPSSPLRENRVIAHSLLLSNDLVHVYVGGANVGVEGTDRNPLHMEMTMGRQSIRSAAPSGSRAAYGQVSPFCRPLLPALQCEAFGSLLTTVTQ